MKWTAKSKTEQGVKSKVQLDSRKQIAAPEQLPWSNNMQTSIGVDGQWTHKKNPGSIIETIKGETIYWHDGAKTKIVAEGRTKYAMKLDGSVYHGTLFNDQLVWDDGDVWVLIRSVPTTAN